MNNNHCLLKARGEIRSIENAEQSFFNLSTINTL